MNIIFWNCQGIRNKDTVWVLKNWVASHRPDILVLIKPKISGTKADTVCKKLTFNGWVRIECYGFSGGIWLFWKSSVSITVVCSSP